MNHLEKLQAQIDADPEAKRRWEEIGRRNRPTLLKMAAWIEGVFPPESPTSNRRGGRKTEPSFEFRGAVCAFLNANMGFEYEDIEAGFQAAMKSGNVDFFRMMANAAQYVADMPSNRSRFAQHVIAARKIAAELMGPEGPMPSWKEIRKAVSAIMGQAAYGDKSAEWSRVKDTAGLSDFPR